MYSCSRKGVDRPRVFAASCERSKDRRADSSQFNNELKFTGSGEQAEAIVENFSDDDYMVQVSITAFADPGNYLWVRYTDANNGYRFKLYDDPGKCKRIHLHSFVNGEATLLDSVCYTHSLPLAIKVKLSGSSIKMWAGGTLKVDLTDSDHAEGRVAGRSCST